MGHTQRTFPSVLDFFSRSVRISAVPVECIEIYASLLLLYRLDMALQGAIRLGLLGLGQLV